MLVNLNALGNGGYTYCRSYSRCGEKHFWIQMMARKMHDEFLEAKDITNEVKGMLRRFNTRLREGGIF